MNFSLRILQLQKAAGLLHTNVIHSLILLSKGEVKDAIYALYPHHWNIPWVLPWFCLCNCDNVRTIRVKIVESSPRTDSKRPCVLHLTVTIIVTIGPQWESWMPWDNQMDQKRSIGDGFPMDIHGLWLKESPINHSIARLYIKEYKG